MRRTSAVVGGLVVVLAMALFAGPAGAVTLPSLDRIDGDTRYDTAAEISNGFQDIVQWTIVATGENFPDALAGSAAAAKLGANILLVQKNQVPAVTETVLSEDHKPMRIIVLGGDAAIHPDVRDKVLSFATGPGDSLEISGGDRYETAVELSKAVFTNPAEVSKVYVATGVNFPDALAGAAAAGADDAPILLVPPTGLTQSIEDELTRLDPNDIVILGGDGVVSPLVELQLEALPGVNVDRIEGPDRYATSAAIATEAFPNATHVYLTTGLNFPDALAIGPVAAANGRPILLTRPECIPQSVVNRIEGYNGLTDVTILGGTTAVSNEVAGGAECVF